MKDALKERGRALENEFFDKENRHVLERLRAAHEHDEQLTALASACGLDDATLLEHLIENGVRAENIAALSLVPLVLVAWADREVAWNERKVILQAAADHAIEPGSAPYELLERWLSERPKRTLALAWGEYVKLLSGRLGAEEREGFAESIMRRAREVSEAAGGILGIGPATSAEERAVLDRLAQSFVPD